MANPYRGELDLQIKLENGDLKTYTLTMGMAEIAKMEAALEVRGQALWMRLLQQSVGDYIRVGQILLERKHKNVGAHIVEQIIETVGMGGRPDSFSETIFELQGRCRFGPEWPDVKARMVKEAAEGEKKEPAAPNA